MKDINIFENGWNEMNAYIFGWVMSDGCLSRTGRNKNRWTVVISSKDKEILSWMYSKMCADNRLYRQKEKNYILRYRNEKGIDFMIKAGLTMRKSLIAIFPELPDNVVRHFIRGYFDGNGSIIIRKTAYNTYGQASITCGSEKFICELQNVLSKNDIESHIYCDGRANNRAKYLRVIKRSEIEKFFDYMYEDCNPEAVLRRKYEKYHQYILECPLKYKIS